MPPTEVPKYYLDACVLVDMVSQRPGEPDAPIVAVLEAADKGYCHLVTSTVTMVEVLRAAHEKSDDKAVFDAAVTAKINALWEPGSPIQLVHFHELIAWDVIKHYRDRLKDGEAAVRGKDLVHLITASREKVDAFFTRDMKLRKWGERLGFEVCEPHAPQPPDPDSPPDGMTKPEDVGLFEQQPEAESPPAKKDVVGNAQKTKVAGAKSRDTSGGRDGLRGRAKARTPEAQTRDRVAGSKEAAPKPEAPEPTGKAKP